MTPDPELDYATQLDRGRAVRLIDVICQVAAAPCFIDDSRVALARQGVIAAVQRHNTPGVFDWLIDALSYQGVSDSIAYGYMEQHCSATIWMGRQRQSG